MSRNLAVYIVANGADVAKFYTTETNLKSAKEWEEVLEPNETLTIYDFDNDNVDDNPPLYKAEM